MLWFCKSAQCLIQAERRTQRHTMKTLANFDTCLMVSIDAERKRECSTTSGGSEKHRGNMLWFCKSAQCLIQADILFSIADQTGNDVQFNFF